MWFWPAGWRELTRNVGVGDLQGCGQLVEGGGAWRGGGALANPEMGMCETEVGGGEGYSQRGVFQKER